MATLDNKLRVLGTPEETEVTPSELGAGPDRIEEFSAIDHPVVPTEFGEESLLNPSLKKRERFHELEQLVDPYKPVTPLKALEPIGMITDPIAEVLGNKMLDMTLKDTQYAQSIAKASADFYQPGDDDESVLARLGEELSNAGLSNEESDQAAKVFLQNLIPGVETDKEWEHLSMNDLRKIMRENFQERSFKEQLFATLMTLPIELLGAGKVTKSIGALKQITQNPTQRAQVFRNIANAVTDNLNKAKFWNKTDQYLSGTKNIDFNVKDFSQSVKNFYGTDPIPDSLKNINDLILLQEAGVDHRALGLRLQGQNVFKEMEKYATLQKNKFNSKGVAVGASWRNKFSRPNRLGGQVFTVQDNGIVTGFNVTIQDIAQDLPKYWNDLDADQKALMLEAKNYFNQFRKMLDDHHINITDAVLAPNQVID